MKQMVTCFKTSICIGFVIAAVLAIVLVDLDDYSLIRQTLDAELGAFQKSLILCYSLSLYFLFLLPFSFIVVVIVSLSIKLLNRLRKKESPANSTYTVKRVNLLRNNKLNIFRRFVFSLLFLSLLYSAIGYFHENAAISIDYCDVESNTPRDMNAILIVIDTLRADHLGCYGYERNTTPFIDAFAREGALFKYCYVQTSWTKPSVASILTSLYPAIHGTNQFKLKLPTEVTTIGEIMQREGFITYSYVANPNLKTIFHFNQGFMFFDDYLMRDKAYLATLRKLPLLSGWISSVTKRSFTFIDRDNIGLANSRIIRWLERYGRQNFFMYLHYQDPHTPYMPPSPYNRMFRQTGRSGKASALLSLYDGEIRFVDDNLARLFEKLKELGIYDKSLVIITSDHGEAFGDHNDWGHDHTIYGEQLHVPLIVKYSGVIEPGAVVEEAVSSIDIVPTILDIAGIENKLDMDGASFLDMMNEDHTMGQGNEIYIDHVSATGDFRLKGVIEDNRWKYILTEKSQIRNILRLGLEELYDIETDPGELYDLAGKEKEILVKLRERCSTYSEYCRNRAIKSMPVDDLDSETLQQLKFLGYIQ